MNNSSVSAKSFVREMDADQVRAEAQALYEAQNWRGIAPEERGLMDAYKKQYQQLTGQTLKLEFITYP